MKYISLFILIILLACNEQEERSDAYGNFEATTTTISAESNGKLLELEIREGQKLKEGQPVALIDTSLLVLKMKKLEANLATLPKKLKNTLAEIDVIKKQRSNLIRERDRVERLLSKKAATTKQLDDLNGNIEVLDKQVSVLKSQTNLANSAILSEKEPLFAEMALLKDQIQKCKIINPINGIVINKLSEEHEMVAIGKPLYQIAKMDTMTLKFYVDAIQLQELKHGTPIQVLIDDGKEDYTSLEGKIYWISEVSEFTPKTIQTKEDRVNLVYAVKAFVANESANIKIGMPAEVLFYKSEKSKQ